jgi:hypothetical protein
VALLVGVIVVALRVLIPAGAPSAPECSASWNARENRGLRGSVPGRGYDLAIVNGSLTKGRYAYCAVTLLVERRGGRWQAFTRLEGEYQELPEATGGWYSDGGGRNWDPRPGAPSVNATVGPDRTVHLSEWVGASAGWGSAS